METIGVDLGNCNIKTSKGVIVPSLITKGENYLISTGYQIAFNNEVFIIGEGNYDTNLDKNFVNVVNMLSKGSISSKIFKDILEEVLTSNLSVEEILKEKNISLMSDTSKLEEIIKKVLKENETSVNDYKSGKQNALKFLMGMIMKETKGSANPKIVNDMLIDLLSKDVN